MRRKKIAQSVLMVLAALIFTLFLSFVDVRNVSATGGEIGFAAVNLSFASAFSFNRICYEVSEVLGYMAFLPVLFFALLGLHELIGRKSLNKVDGDLYALVIAYVLFAALYFIFDKVFVVNFRPLIMPGETVPSPSFPSSHTLLSVVMFGTAIMECGRIGDKRKRTVVTVILAVLMIALIAFRLFSGVHWLTDIIGGLLWGEVILLFFQYFVLLFTKNK